MTGTPEYQCWLDIKRRCLNRDHPMFVYYGGRGIGICDQWRTSFRTFVADMGPRPRGHTIERVDNSLGYEPSNCKWATRKDQQRNTRGNRRITFADCTKTIAEWAETLGINHSTIRHRLFAYGWTVEDALSRPVRSTGGRIYK